MGAEVIQARYDELESIARSFGEQSEAATTLQGQIRQSFQALTDGSWEGAGSEAFTSEMQGEVFPALQRMILAFATAESVTMQLKEIMRAAEEEAASRYGQAFEALNLGSAPTSSYGLSVTDMKPQPKGELYIKDPADNRDIHPNDAKQGSIGDCFLVTSLVSIATQNPDLLKNAIKDNKDGTYTVTFYEKIGAAAGKAATVKPVQVTVNSDLPVGLQDNKDGKPPVPVAPHMATSDTKDGMMEIWPTIAEKAYAQWKGDGSPEKGYAVLDEGGFTSDVLFELTGKESITRPSSGFSMKDLAKMENDGYAITLSSLHSAAHMPLYQNGTLITSHAYYISEINAKTGTVTVQNPWGWDEFKVELPYEQMQKNFGDITVNPLK